MKTAAMVLNTYGQDAKFTPSEIELPPLKNNEVLIEVSATSLNPVDNKIMRGAPIGPELPAALHGDVAGTIIKIGDKVKTFKTGDQVFGIAGGVTNHGGASANHMIANENLIYHKPKTCTFEEAAALPLVFITAYEGLIEKAKLKKGQNILVIGGTGGVGHQAIQIAKMHGAHVTATVSSDQAAKIAKSLGADIVINRKQVSIDQYHLAADITAGFDIVFDTVGGEHIDSDWALIRPNGQVITTTSMESHDLTPMHMKGASLHVVFMLLPMLTNQDKKRHQSILKYLAQAVDAKAIKPLLAKQSFPLSDINDAHSLYERGDFIGKIVITNNKKR